MSNIVPISFNGQSLFPISAGKARTKAQQALIEYLNECMEHGTDPDAEWMAINVYKKHVRVLMSTKWGSKVYGTYKECWAENPNSEIKQTRCWDGYNYVWRYRTYTMTESSARAYIHTFKQWYTTNLGSLVRQGLLFTIPTGYILKRIESTIEIGE